EKMGGPKFRDLVSDRLREVEAGEGARIRAIAGELGGGRFVGPVEGLAVAPKFVDVSLPVGARFREAVPAGHTAFAYVDAGEVRFAGSEPVRAPALVIFAEGDGGEGRVGAARAGASRGRAVEGGRPPARRGASFPPPPRAPPGSRSRAGAPSS